MTAGLRFFYRHIHVTGLENIPPQGPVIIIANHNSSLMDAALLGILLRREAYFFARGDVFVNKPVQTILWWLHMMPVHSYQGGRNTLSANSNSFASGQKVLSKAGIIVFFPESTSHTEHQLLPFRKGVFRLAFDTAAAHDFSLDIPIVPVGITYDHPVSSRTNVLVHAGKPLLLSAYVKEYKENPAVALLRISKDAREAMDKLVLHVADHKRLPAAEQYLTINRNNYPVTTTSWKITSSEKLEREKAVCSIINNTNETEMEEKQQRAGDYFTALSAAGITDKTVSSNRALPGWKKILLWAGFPFYAAGLLVNGLPVMIARRIADKKVYRQDFYSWIFVACYSVMYFLWLAALWLAGLLFGWKWTLVLLATIIIAGIFAYTYKGWLEDRRQQNLWQSLNANKRNELLAMRRAIE
ncbi:MAG: 1-acyl-sn-glycerol-3-phosphate acyltransferase [Chitinophagaceae bacterium]